MQRQAALTIEYVALDKLEPHPKNARDHTSAAQVDDSLDAHGQYKPMIVQLSTGYVLAGNGLYARLVDRGDSQGAVTYVDVDDEQALRILLVDNETSDRSGYDEVAMAELLLAMGGDYTGTGWTPANAADLVELFGKPLSAKQLADAYGDEPDESAFWPTTRIPLPGDLYDWWIALVAEHDGKPWEALRQLHTLWTDWGQGDG